MKVGGFSEALYFIRPVGQAVKTRPFHGCNMGSIPVRVIKTPLRNAQGRFCFVPDGKPGYIIQDRLFSKNKIYLR